MMQQQDYLKKQIDQLGRILGKILNNLLGLKNNEQLNDGIENTNSILKRELDLDIQTLIALPTNEIVNTLKTQKHFTHQNLDTLAEILLLLAISNEEYKKLYAICLTIYEYLEQEESAYSLNRQW